MPQYEDLKSLDSLIASIGGADVGAQSFGPYGLLLEHLQAARRDFLGSSLDEYRLSLRQAKGSVGCITDKSARNTIKAALESLLATADRISSLDRARSLA